MKKEKIKTNQQKKPKDPIRSECKAHGKYHSKDGTVLPGVSTITGGWGENKGPLMWWGYNMGRDEIDLNDYLQEVKKIGKLAHSMITDGLLNQRTDLTKYSEQQISYAENAYLSFLNWQKTHHLEPKRIELPLISEKYKYGGKLDIYGLVDGIFEVIDLKTGSGIYDSHLVGTVAYKQLLEENGFPVERIRILNIPRTEDDRFDDIVLGNTDTWWRIFLNLLDAYYLYRPLQEKRKLKFNLRKQKGEKG